MRLDYTIVPLSSEPLQAHLLLGLATGHPELLDYITVRFNRMTRSHKSAHLHLRRQLLCKHYTVTAASVRHVYTQVHLLHRVLLPKTS